MRSSSSAPSWTTGDDDHVPIAVVGVNSPYAAFERSPEARAVQAAADLGTLVIAPAGGEGEAARFFDRIVIEAASPQRKEPTGADTDATAASPATRPVRP